MKIKTAEASGDALAYCVAKLEGRDCYVDADGVWFRDSATHPDGFETDYLGWTLCGPIIKREGISLSHKWHNGEWHAIKQVDPKRPSLPGHLHCIVRWHPSDPLIAAMRCYVASKLGDEVEVPEELV